MGLARATGAACALACILAACAQGSPDQADIQTRTQALLSRRLDDPRLARFIDLADPAQADRQPSAENPPWGLDRLTLVALYFHPDLAISRSRLRLAQAQAVSARARPVPGISASLGRGAGAGAASAWIVGAAIDFLLETGDRRRLRQAQADALVQAARADLIQASWQVRAGVYTALLDLWSARRRIDALDQQLELQARRVAAFERRVESGENPRGDLRRELDQRDRLSAAFLQAQADQARARVELSQAIGVPVAALEGITPAFDKLDQDPGLDLAAQAAPLRKLALTRRADMRDLLARIEAAQLDLQSELSRQWPDLRVGPGYQFDLGADKYAISASADWPRSIKGPAAEARARRDLSIEQLLARQANLLAQVDSALALWQAGCSAWDSAQAVTERAARSERSAGERFAAGALARPDLLAARIDRIEATRMRQSALELKRRSLAALEDALQWPVESGRAPPLAAAGDELPDLAAPSVGMP